MKEPASKARLECVESAGVRRGWCAEAAVLTPLELATTDETDERIVTRPYRLTDPLLYRQQACNQKAILLGQASKWDA